VSEPLRKTPWTLGRYEVLGEIARGAMGVVYKARDPLIDRVVAIKTIALGLSDAETEAFERRFFREAKSAGRLNHPNVVTIYDVGKSGDVAYIAMEFLDGRSLREILDSGVVLSTDTIVDIVAQVAEGLAFAHEQQVIHRDVKPANIMVLTNGTVKITDFGIALLPTGTRTLAGNVFGSPRYTSPEQVIGRPVDGRSDIFSLGAVLYEMLTGRPPFAGDDLNSILTQVLSDPTPAPSSHNPKIPRAFDHIVGKAVAKDPQDRYQSAYSMAMDLRNHANLEFTTPAPAPLPALEHPTGELGRTAPLPDVAPAAAPLAVPDDASPVAAMNAGRQRLRIALGIAGLAIAAVIAIALWPASTSTPVATAPTPGDASNRAVTAAISPGESTSAAGSAPRAAPAAESAATAKDAVPAAPASNSGLAASAKAAPGPVPASGTAASPGPAPAAVAAVPSSPASTPVAVAAAPSSPASTPPSATVATSDAPPKAPGAAGNAGTPAAAAVGAGPTAAPVAAAGNAAAPRPAGRVSFAVAPWGIIHVDGRVRGVSPPLQELKLPPGKHTIEIRNGTFAPYRETIDVTADGVVKVKHKFQ
jgi:serine/threonine-protein kinase